MNIEELKKEILLKIMSEGMLSWYYIETLPKDDSLRTFICGLDPGYAYAYAYFVDESSHPDTRTSSCRDPLTSCWYARYVDKCPHEETRKSSYRDPRWKRSYIENFGE
jgi:hypothetical protein